MTHDNLATALEPFAHALDEWGDEPEHPDSASIWEHPLSMLVTIGDFRHAKDATRHRTEAIREAAMQSIVEFGELQTALERAEEAEAKLASILSPENVEKAARAIYDAEDPLSGDHIATVLHLSDHLFWDSVGDDSMKDVDCQLEAVRIICRAAARAALASIGEGQ